MRKKLLSLFMAAVLAMTTLLLPAQAAGNTGFSDITDNSTAVSVETMRLMGVLGGYADGTFRPSGQLTRAQFCKMAVYAMDSAAEVGKYRTVTIFPDVKPSHWAAGYINLAARGLGIIGGYPNGSFSPDRTVTLGHAVTILLRLLGYKDEEVGGVWPDSYVALADSIGLTEGIAAGGSAPLTRAGAARLFRNLLECKTAKGGTLYTLSDETELRSVDGSTGELITADDTYKMVHPVSSTSLVGARGYVVLNAQGSALTFLPITSGSGGSVSGAVVLSQDRSSAGLSELAGGSNYALYKNGLPITVAGLRKYDVATYYSDTHAIRVCDTRVTVYYEACEPSPSAPTKITVLGGTELSVLPSARESLAKFKIGQSMTLLLTADGQVASAMAASGSARSNAVGLVSQNGSIDLLCGTGKIRLAAKADAAYYGQLVRVSASGKGELSLTVPTGGVSGDLNVGERTLGAKQLADNVMVIEGGQQISLSQLTSGIIKQSQITYARTNWEGEVDLLVLNGGSGSTVYGRASVRSTVDGGEKTTYVEVTYGDKSTGEIAANWPVSDGAFVEATVKEGRFTYLAELTELKNVSNSSWNGTSSVMYGGQSYMVPSTVLCYNRDSGRWVTLTQALAYSNRTTLHVKDGVVRVVEVGT